MEKITAAITGVGSYVPDYRLTNQELETMVETNDEWIVSRTGIKERRILKDENAGTSFMAIRAAEALIENHNVDPQSIELVIVCTASPDLKAASTAVYTASQIGATNAFGFDLDAACSSFLYGMSVAARYIESGKYKRVLLIGADKCSSFIDYTDRATCIIFGDGAGAVLFEPNTEGYGIQDEELRSDGVGREFLNVKAGGSLLHTTEETVKQGLHYVRQDGKTVFKQAVSKMADISEMILEKNNITHSDIQWMAAHQANKRIIDATANRLGIEKDKVLINIENYGNTTSATLPLLIADFEKQFKKGDRILFTTFGGGFTWGAMIVTWAY